MLTLQQTFFIYTPQGFSEQLESKKYTKYKESSTWFFIGPTANVSFERLLKMEVVPTTIQRIQLMREKPFTHPFCWLLWGVCRKSQRKWILLPTARSNNGWTCGNFLWTLKKKLALCLISCCCFFPFAGQKQLEEEGRLIVEGLHSPWQEVTAEEAGEGGSHCIYI